MRAPHNQGDLKSFLYLWEKIKKANKPNCNKMAVYLLLKARPIKIPPKIKNHFFSSKIALYKQIKLSVQNNNKGTSGVELKDKIEMNIVDANNTKAFCNFSFDKK